MWLLGELQIEYEHVPAGGPFGGLSDPEHVDIAFDDLKGRLAF